MPPTQSYKIPTDEAMKALAKSGQGHYYTDVNTSGTHLRVLVTGIGSRGALAIALPLTEIDNALHNQLLLLAIISRRRYRARRAARDPRRAHGARTRSPGSRARQR